MESRKNISNLGKEIFSLLFLYHPHPLRVSSSPSPNPEEESEAEQDDLAYVLYLFLKKVDDIILINLMLRSSDLEAIQKTTQLL